MVDCDGNEVRLDQCSLPLGWSSRGGSGNEGCSHSEEAGVICYTGNTQLLLSSGILIWSFLLKTTSTVVMEILRTLVKNWWAQFITFSILSKQLRFMKNKGLSFI